MRARSEKRKVWRISERAPLGEWVAADTPPAVTRAPRTDLPEVSSGGWVMSSFDLLSGADVVEGTDTLSPDLLDELFAPGFSTPPKQPRG